MNCGQKTSGLFVYNKENFFLFLSKKKKKKKNYRHSCLIIFFATVSVVTFSVFIINFKALEIAHNTF